MSALVRGLVVEERVATAEDARLHIDRRFKVSGPETRRFVIHVARDDDLRLPGYFLCSCTPDEAAIQRQRDDGETFCEDVTAVREFMAAPRPA